MTDGAGMEEDGSTGARWEHFNIIEVDLRADDMKAMALRFRLLFCARLSKYLNSTSVHLLFVIRIPHLQQ